MDILFPSQHRLDEREVFWLCSIVAMQGVSLWFTLQDKRSEHISLYRVWSEKHKVIFSIL